MVQQSDDEFEIGGDDEEEDKDPDSIESILAKALKDATKADDAPVEEDTGSIFSEPLKEPEPNTAVSAEDGQKLIEEAEAQKRNRKGQFTKAGEPAAEAEPASTPPEAKATPAAEPAKAAEPDAPLTYDAVLSGMSEPQRAAVAARVAVSDEVGSIYTTNESLKAYGETPQAAFKRLSEISAYAAKNPGEYIAWAAGTTGNAQEVLGQAAAVLGFKIVPAQGEESGEDDPFEDPAIKELKAENARLKAAQQPAPAIGPDNPEQRAQNDLVSFQRETNQDGTPKRPLFDQLTPQIAEAAAAHVKATGQPVTLADLDRFYTQTVTSLREKMGIPAAQPNLAATHVPQMPTVDPTKAAAIAKAQAASKSLDGAGHGAGRHPAPPEGASIADTMKFIMGQASGN